jgi:hypothetical protein
MTTMQRWELSAFGRENLSLVSVPRPVPGADEVLVEVEAVSLNFRDSLTGGHPSPVPWRGSDRQDRLVHTRSRPRPYSFSLL